jgi:glycosyltransferase involved in cell wall biosynthesis
LVCGLTEFADLNSSLNPVPDSGSNQNQVKISVIVPVRNEADSIGSLLDALLNQSLAPTEIVITDGGSTDSTTAIIQKYIDSGARVKLIRTTRALPGRGRNLAVAHSSSEWLAFMDAGVHPDKRWLEFLVEPVTRDPAVEVVYGAYEPRIDTFFKECAAITYVSPPTEVEGSMMRERFIACALMRRGVWEMVGGFPEHLRSAEDLLFMKKVEAAKFRIALAPRAMVQWDLQPNFWRTFKRFTIYARNNIRAGLWREWQRPILSRYLVLMILAVAALVFGWWWLTVPGGLWLLMLLARAVVAIRRNRNCFPASLSRNLLRLVILMPLIAVLDLGSIIGSVQWVLTDKLGLKSEAVNVGHGT